MAFHLGWADPDALLAYLPAPLFDEWVEYFQTEPWGQDRMEAMVGQVCMILANANRDSKKRPSPFKLEDFLFQKREGKRKQTVEEQRAALENIARKLGAKRNDRNEHR